jgi:hypothetical protein
LVAATNMKTLPSFMPKPEIHSNSQRDVSSAWAALYKKISRDGSRQIVLHICIGIVALELRPPPVTASCSRHSFGD